jgi:hypothetical protein
VTTRRRYEPPSNTSRADFGDDDPTIVEDPSVRQEWDQVTPVTMPRCVDCGRVVFFDGFDEAASLIAMHMFSADRCVRSRDGRMRWCGEAWELRYRPPR